MQKDLHEKPFDEGTLKKLDIFEAYTKQWLPTFIMNNYESDIYIFDLFIPVCNRCSGKYLYGYHKEPIITGSYSYYGYC